MKGHKIIALAAAIMFFLLIFCACNRTPTVAETTTGAAGGSDISPENTTSSERTTESVTVVSDEKLIALTFDDGPRASTTNRILDVLESNGAAATFFLVGYNIERNVGVIQRAAEIGCEIANHSNDHKNLTKCTADELRAQVDTPNKTLKTLAGVDVKLFRAPGGNFKGVEADIGMPLIQWSIDTEDWRYKDAAHPGRTKEEREADLKAIADRVVANAEKGDIILMHDIYDFTADLCDIIVPRLVENGFKLVTVSDMYAAYGEELKGGKVYYNVDFSKSNLVLNAGAYIVKTNGGVLNVRQKPEADSPSLEKIPNGTAITVSNSVPGWAYVTYNSVSGWVNATYLSSM